MEAPQDPGCRTSLLSGRRRCSPGSTNFLGSSKRSLPSALAEGLHRRWSGVAAAHRRLPPALRQKIFTLDAAGDLMGRDGRPNSLMLRMFAQMVNSH